MKTWTVALSVVLALLSPLSAQTSSSAPASAPAAGAGPNGEIVGTGVYVRAGPSTNDYFVAKVSMPQKVTVLGEKNGWVQVAPLPGCYSVVAKEYVRLDASGRTGTVTGNGVWARAAGDLKQGAKLGDFWSLQKQLSAGQQVQVLSTGSDYYAIATPPGGTFWISGQYVKYSGALATVAASPARVPTSVASRPAPTSRVAPPPRVLSAGEIALNAAEADLKAEYDKPAEQRDLRGMLAKYQAIDPGDDAYVKSAVEGRIAWLTGEAARMQKIRDLQSAIAAAQEQQAKREMVRSAISTSAAAAVPVVPDYALKGSLEASVVFTGEAGQPKRYVVHNPQTREVAGYAQGATPDAQADLAKAVGKQVGLFGAARYDGGLRSTLVEVQRVDVLDDNGQVVEPPKPTVHPLPPPKSVPASPAAEAVVPAASGTAETVKPASPAPPEAPPASSPAPAAPASEPASAPAPPPEPPASAPASDATSAPATAPPPLPPRPELPPTGLPTVTPASGPAATIEPNPYD